MCQVLDVMRKLPLCHVSRPQCHSQTAHAHAIMLAGLTASPCRAALVGAALNGSRTLLGGRWQSQAAQPVSPG
jgi:hypothetical protein